MKRLRSKLVRHVSVRRQGIVGLALLAVISSSVSVTTCVIRAAAATATKAGANRLVRSFVIRLLVSRIVVPLVILVRGFQGIPGTLCYANLDSGMRLAAWPETFVRAYVAVR